MANIAYNKFRLNFSFGTNLFIFNALDDIIKKKKIPKKISDHFIVCCPLVAEIETN